MVYYILDLIIYCQLRRRISLAIWLQLDSFNINVSVLRLIIIMRYTLTPLLHGFFESSLVILATQIKRMLILTNQSDSERKSALCSSTSMVLCVDLLCASSNIGDTKVLLIEQSVDCAVSLTLEDLGRQVELISNGSCQANTMNRLESLIHSLDCP